ncbi:MAG TPA: hypothetical protein VGQ57_16325 [Polyangiaceae bacterium]|nr:hypothetical protein [Polyangiaceae bacterium]
MSPHRLAATAAFGMAALASPVRAEAPSADIARARELFADATALEAAGDYGAARVKLEGALAIKETPGLRYHLAHCEEQSGALTEAGANYERAAELIRAGATAPDVEPLLPAASARIDAHVARLEIVVPPGIVATAELDGKVLPPAAPGGVVKVDPCAHRLRVFSPGHADFTADMAFSSGERRTVKVFFDTSGPAPAEAPMAATASRAAPEGNAWHFGGREVVILGEAALTLTGLGLGIGYTIARGNAAERVEQAQAVVDAGSGGGNAGCDATPSPPACADLSHALDDHRRTTTIATASFVGAGVAAGALALTWALWPASHGPLTVAIHPQATGVGMLAGGRF